MAAIPPPPSFVSPVGVDPVTQKPYFEPAWLQWFLDIAQILTAAGGTGGIDHEDLSSLFGGAAGDHWHLTQAQHDALLNDQWTYAVLGSDFDNATTANNAVTGLNFTPQANKRYHIEGLYLLQTAVAATGARPGISWPSGYTDGAAFTAAPNSTTAFASQFGTPAAGTANAASTGLAVINRSYLGRMEAILVTGGSPSGNFQVTLASEATDNVRMKAGSFLRYRTY